MTLRISQSNLRALCSAAIPHFVPVHASLSRRLGACAVLAAGTLLGTSNAWAGISDTVTPFVGVGYSYDDNLFRLEDNDTVAAGEPRADSIRSAYAGLQFERPIGRQVLTGSARVTQVSFAHFDQLNYNAKDFTGNLQWSLWSHLTGNVGVSRSETLTPFSDFHTSDRNLRVQHGAYAEANWLFHPRWQVHGRVASDEYRYDLSTQQYLDRNVDSTELGFDYLAATGSTIGLQAQEQRASYLNPITSSTAYEGYKQESLNLKVFWRITAQSQLQFLGGRARRIHDGSGAADSSGTNGKMTAQWSPTAAFWLNASLWRQYEPFEGSGISYSLDDGALVGAAWKPRDNIKVELQARHIKRNFQGNSTTSSASLIGAQDQTDTVTLSLDYQFRDNIRLTGSVFHDKRDANSLYTTSYKANGATLNATIQF